MKKLIKVAVVLIVIAIVAAVGLIWFAVSSVDRAAKLAIEKGGTYALGVPTKLDSADVGILAGTFELKGLNVANPSGFTSPHFMNLGSGGVKIDYDSLKQKVIELPAFTLDNIDVHLERKEGKSNYEAILESVKRFQSSDPASKPAEESDGPKLIVRDLTVSNINVHVNMLPLGGELTKLDVKVDKVQLTNIGDGGAGPVEIAELVAIIVQAVLQAVADSAGAQLPGELLTSLSGKLGELSKLQDLGIGAVAEVGGQVQQLTGSLQGTLEEVGKIGEGLDDAAKKAEEAAKKLQEGVGGLLGGGKKD